MKTPLLLLSLALSFTFVPSLHSTKVDAAAATLLPVPPKAGVWPVTRAWTENEEQRYSDWFKQLAAHRANAWTIKKMLRNQADNSLYTEEDDSLPFGDDCADLPYVVRAYYSYKRGLPFILNFVSGNQTSNTGNPTRATEDNLSFHGTLKGFFNELKAVHSGHYRTPPEAVDSFTYPLAVNSNAIRPGMVYYDVNGHVALVADCLADGTVMLADAHPDLSVTRRRFNAFALWEQSRTHSGGFRGFRKVEVQEGKVVWVKDNAGLFEFSREQYAEKYSSRAAYAELVRSRMATQTVPARQVFADYIRKDLCQMVRDRVKSVERGWKAAAVGKIEVPENIYKAEGNWENFSTPAGDMRLRLAMLAIPDRVKSLMAQARTKGTGPKAIEDLGRELLALKESLFDEPVARYTNSLGEEKTLSLRLIEKRLFRLSFDPNHAPELRWGAGDAEIKKLAGTSNPRFTSGYEEQQGWRNLLIQKTGPMKPDPTANENVPAHDLSKQIRKVIADESAKAPRAILAEAHQKE